MSHFVLFTNIFRGDDSLASIQDCTHYNHAFILHASPFHWEEKENQFPSFSNKRIFVGNKNDCAPRKWKEKNKKRGGGRWCFNPKEITTLLLIFYSVPQCCFLNWRNRESQDINAAASTFSHCHWFSVLFKVITASTFTLVKPTSLKITVLYSHSEIFIRQ